MNTRLQAASVFKPYPLLATDGWQGRVQLSNDKRGIHRKSPSIHGSHLSMVCVQQLKSKVRYILYLKVFPAGPSSLEKISFFQRTHLLPPFSPYSLSGRSSNRDAQKVSISPPRALIGYLYERSVSWKALTSKLQISWAWPEEAGTGKLVVCAHGRRAVAEFKGKKIGIDKLWRGIGMYNWQHQDPFAFFGPLSSNFVSSAIDRGGIELAVDFMPPIHRIKDVTGLGAILRTGILLGRFSPFLSLQTR